MKSAFFFGALIALVMASQIYVSAAHADGCEVTYDDGYTRLFVGTGVARRSPTMEEVFDAMNVKNSPLFQDLKFVPGRSDQPRVYVEVPKTPLFYDIRTIPSQKIGDPACEKPKKGEQPITGYDCRVKQLKENPAAGGLPKGIKTGIAIAVPSRETALLTQISQSLGCDGLYNEDGSPAIKGKGKQVPLVSPGATGGAATKP